VETAYRTAPISSDRARRARATARLRSRLTALRHELGAPERWVLLSTCDWYPDASGFPTNHARLLTEPFDGVSDG
jgi:hypothetical protein